MSISKYKIVCLVLVLIALVVFAAGGMLLTVPDEAEAAPVEARQIVVENADTVTPVEEAAAKLAAGAFIPHLQDDEEVQWCAGVKIRFFVGGAEGDAFGSIVFKGAQAAAADLGPEVEYVFSGWDVERMLAQLRDAIAAAPDGIAMMGHPGDEAIMPLAEEATDAGIIMMYQNVDVPEVRAAFGGGYVGANLDPQGRALAQEAIRTLGLEAGDHVVVFGAWGQPGRFIREEGTALAFEEAGLIVERIVSPPEAATDPNLLTPDIAAAVLANPDIKVISHAGGQTLGAAEVYMDAIGMQPGEIYQIGFDTSPAVIDGLEKGYIQLTSDQQPFLQGYLPILSLCLSKVYGFGPMNVDTGAGFVDANNYESVAELAIEGFR